MANGSPWFPAGAGQGRVMARRSFNSPTSGKNLKRAMSIPPILSLPPEITQRIFREALPIGPPTFGPPRLLSQQAPLLVTQICRQWRDIGLHTPELWQSLSIDPSIVSVNRALVALWMSRANNRPRDITFNTQDPDVAADLLEESMAYCDKWRDVKLVLPIDSFPALASHHGPFPILRSLSLSLNDEVWEGDQRITILGAPLLREVTLADFPFLTVDIAWGQLTTLKMTASVVSAGLSVLRRASSLVNLHFALIDPRRAPLAVPPFVLPSLTHLKTSGKSILPALTVPSLEQLDIRGLGSFGEMESLTDPLRALLERSACPLKRLLFRVPDITADEFRSLLQAIASVEDLTLTFQFPTGLDELVTVLQSRDVLPRLTALRITDASRTGQNPMMLFALLETLNARRDTVEGQANLELFTISIQNPRVPTFTEMLEFGNLADKGLHVRVVTPAGVLMDR
ncbi:hypothetical protein FB451DRAFT_204514 [Mycena latifolia]|nr:hypothetical protein FB451DRAFT_204514 [Mycena latifolia]